MMAVDLPSAIADYFAADKGQIAEPVSLCFTEDAIVRRWKARSSRKYTYTVEPFMIGSEDNRIVVTSHLAGDFPGSPLDLRYVFVLEGEKIAALEIVP
jgi:hypothetical protein